MKIILAALFLLPVMSFAQLKTGDPAPDFELPGSDGKTYKLSDLKGKTVVIAWFPKAFTGGWTKECESLRESGADLEKFDVVYFAASCDPAEKNTKFAESLSLNYPILSDPGKETATAYGVVNETRKFPQRWTFYIDGEGKILYIDQKVKAAMHGGDVVAKLKELGVSEK